MHDSSNLKNPLVVFAAPLSSSPLFPLLRGPALWDPVLGALPRGGAHCAAGGPALAATFTPARVRRGASGASSWCARRWGCALQGWRPLGAASDCQRVAQGSTARFLFGHAAARRTSGSSVCTTHQAYAARRCGRRAAMEADAGKFLAGLQSAPRDTGLRRARCAFACFFVFMFPLFSLISQAAKLARDLGIHSPLFRSRCPKKHQK